MNDISGFDDVNIPKRRVIDATLNQHGHSFIEFLNESKMCMLNGRCDAENDNYTSISTRGKAVVDYICAPHENLDKCESFKVIPTSSLFGERSRAPDHSSLIVEFRKLHSVIKEQSSQINDSTEQKRY